MCFSAPVSFTASAFLIGVGLATLRQPLPPRERPFATLPLLFGMQQFIEGGLWVRIPAFGTDTSTFLLVQAYALFVGSVWPVLVPMSLRCLEPAGFRRQVLDGLTALGLVMATYTVGVSLSQGFTATIIGQCMIYGNPAGTWPGTLVLYATAVCAPFFVSSDRRIQGIGAAQLIGLAVAYGFYRNALPSVWCFFAAIVSALIYLRARVPAASRVGIITP